MLCGACGIHVLLAILFAANPSLAEIKIASINSTPEFAFSGEGMMDVAFNNPGSNSFKGNIQIRLFQCSSATIMPVGQLKAWKKVELSSGQRTLETLAIDYPSIQVETIFQVHFFDEEKKSLGKITVNVLPRDLLKGLSGLCGKNPVGLFDPENQLKSTLAKLGVEFQDLEDDARFESFHGSLLIAGPFLSLEKIPESLRARISAKAKESCAVVWLLPPSLHEPFASVIVIRTNGSEVALRDASFRHLAQSASAQVTLLRSAQFALNPDKLPLLLNPAASQ
jgi:hypothetical protein